MEDSTTKEPTEIQGELFTILTADSGRLGHVEKELLSLQEELDSANAEKAQFMQEKSDLLSKWRCNWRKLVR